MRHWGATYRVIQSDFDLLPVSHYLGHPNTATTEVYVHIAQRVLRERMRGHRVQPLESAA